MASAGNAGIYAYRVGDVIIVPAHERHALHNTGDVPLRQLCIFGEEPHTVILEREDSENVVEVFNSPEPERPWPCLRFR